MVRFNSARSHSDVAATERTPLPVPDDAFEAPPSTKRFSAADLAAVVATMNEPHPATDEIPTVEAPAPVIPEGIPSPLGDDEPLAPAGDLALDVEQAFAAIVKPVEDEMRESETPDAVRARRSVVASWVLSAAVIAVVTLLATWTPGNAAEVHAVAGADATSR